jgi:hypothetical protein
MFHLAVHTVRTVWGTRRNVKVASKPKVDLTTFKNAAKKCPVWECAIEQDVEHCDYATNFPARGSWIVTRGEEV